MRERLTMMGVEASCDFNGWTDYFKKPDNVVECVIYLTGAPGWIYAAFVLITFAIGWWQFATRRARDLERARMAVRSRTTSMQQWAASIITHAVIFIVSSHFLARFAVAIWATYRYQELTNPPSPLRPIDSSYVGWLMLDSRPSLTRGTAWTLILALLVIAILLYATLTRFYGLLSATTVLLRAIQFSTIGIGVVSTLPILTVLVDQKLPAAVTALLYGAWIAALSLVSYSTGKLEEAGKSYG